jgi:phosphoribosylformimino-5-aminoimidazole carboxamide ribotide isomerase
MDDPKGIFDMQVIPVLDLKGGVVVHARMGARDQYRPIKTPLSPTSNPIDVARGLLSIYPFSTFYIADLDAIAGAGNNDAALAELKAEIPHAIFWVDNGIADLAGADRWLEAGLGHLVLGSETQKDEAVVCRLSKNERIILSLDYRGNDFVGPAGLLNDVDAWPSRVVSMTLARVGSGMGPDWERLEAIKNAGRGRHVYAAGGVRDADDLVALADRGIAGALVASCLHNGSITGAQIARLPIA